MELIDKNALKKAIGSYVVGDAKRSFNELYENEDLLKVFDLVNAMPVIDAIPIEWIEKYVESCHGMFKKDMRWIEIMVSWWKEEQEKQNETIV